LANHLEGTSAEQSFAGLANELEGTSGEQPYAGMEEGSSAEFTPPEAGSDVEQTPSEVSFTEVGSDFVAKASEEAVAGLEEDDDWELEAFERAHLSRSRGRRRLLPVVVACAVGAIIGVGGVVFLKSSDPTSPVSPFVRQWTEKLAGRPQHGAAPAAMATAPLPSVLLGSDGSPVDSGPEAGEAVDADSSLGDGALADTLEGGALAPSDGGDSDVGDYADAAVAVHAGGADSSLAVVAERGVATVDDGAAVATAPETEASDDSTAVTESAAPELPTRAIPLPTKVREVNASLLRQGASLPLWFKTGQHSVWRRREGILEQAAKVMKRDRWLRALIFGHLREDERGVRNHVLARRRALRARNIINFYGVPGSRMAVRDAPDELLHRPNGDPLVTIRTWGAPRHLSPTAD
jgi:outer membrane protein OmpA-like peptidoglycan-associated protein